MRGLPAPLQPVVPLHQSTVLLNMSITSPVTASHQQLGPLHSAQQMFAGFKDLGLVLRNMFTILRKTDRLCYQICKHRGRAK